MAKILKNTTASAIYIKDTGILLPASPANYTIPPQDTLLWAASVDIVLYIGSGDVVVNDGVADLVPIKGKLFLSCQENEEGLMLARKLYEHTGFIYPPNEHAYQYTTMSFDDVTRTFSIQPKAPNLYIEFLYRDVLYQLTGTKTASITDTEGLWYIYFDENQALTASQTPFSFVNHVFVSLIYWDFANKKHIMLAEERHGAIMDTMTHYVHHRTEGTKAENGAFRLAIGNYIENGDGSLDTHAQFSISDGDVFDEDITIPIRHSATPTNPFEQVLSTIAYIPVFYLDGAQNWRRKDPTAFAICENQPNTALYNHYNGSTWTRQACTNDWFFCTWLIYTNDLKYPVAAILGQRQDTTLIQSITNNTRADLQLPNFFTQEKIFYKKLIWQTNTSYVNTPKVRLRYISTASEANPSNDRYAAICSYNGNAGTGKYLDFYPGQSSNQSPYPIPEVSYVRTVIVSSISNKTGTISFYLHDNITVPIFSISLANSSYAKITLSYQLNVDDEIVAKVSSGSFSKPTVTLFIQTGL